MNICALLGFSGLILRIQKKIKEESKDEHASPTKRRRVK